MKCNKNAYSQFGTFELGGNTVCNVALNNLSSMLAAWAQLGNTAASPQFPQKKTTTGGCTSNMAVIINSSPPGTYWENDC